MLAEPPLRATLGPRSAPSIWNWTVPVGVPAPGTIAVTWAVKVTEEPTTNGLAEETTCVLVSALFTVWVMESALPLKSPVA